MFKKSTIQFFSALAMMLVFTFSITPKKFLHDLIADHKDDISFAVNDGHDHIDHHGFNCNCDNLVATSPFTQYNDVLRFCAPAVYNEHFIRPVSGIKSISFSSFTLRGPPSLG